MGHPSRYPEEFRREAVELYRSSDRSRAEVARSLGISDGSLAAWVKQAREAERPGAQNHRGLRLHLPTLPETRHRAAPRILARLLAS